MPDCKPISESDIRSAIINAIAYGASSEAELAKAVVDKLRQLGFKVEDSNTVISPIPRETSA
jgi:hypothetical protein